MKLYGFWAKNKDTIVIFFSVFLIFVGTAAIEAHIRWRFWNKSEFYFKIAMIVFGGMLLGAAINKISTRELGPPKSNKSTRKTKKNGKG
jgi:hypothetical protein